MRDLIENAGRDINSLMQQEAALIREAKAAAEAGNLALYEKKVKAREKVQHAIYMKRTFMDQLKAALSEK